MYNSFTRIVDPTWTRLLNIKKNVTDFDPHYQGSYVPFTKQTRFKDFDYKILEQELNKDLARPLDLDILDALEQQVSDDLQNAAQQISEGKSKKAGEKVKSSNEPIW